MSAEKADRGYLATVFGCYCPRCRRGKLFTHSLSIGMKKNMEMHVNCPVCGQPTDIEVGFYYGTGFVSYFLAVIISLLTLIGWWLTIGFAFHDQRFFYWIGLNALLLILLQPWLMRFSRSLWISWFVSYDPEWRDHQPEITDRINPDQQHNW